MQWHTPDGPIDDVLVHTAIDLVRDPTGSIVSNLVVDPRGLITSLSESVRRITYRRDNATVFR